MTLIEWGALGELIGGVAIIVSLVYVGLQIKQNTDALRLSTVHDATEDMADLYLLPAENGELADIFVRGLQDIDSLSSVERTRLYGFFHKFFRTYENAYFQHTQGVLDSDMYTGITRQFMAVVSMPGGEAYWDDRRSWYGDRFQEHIDNEMSALEGKGFKLN